MSDCFHDSVHLGQIFRHFYGHEFNATTEICDHCQAELWNNNLSDQYSLWLSSLSINEEKKYLISENLDLTIKNISLRLGNYNERKLVSATVSLMNSRLASDSYRDMINLVMAADEFDTLHQDIGTVKKSMIFTNSKGLANFDSWKLILDIEDSELISSYLKILVILAGSENSSFKFFWNKTFKPDLELLLSAI